MKTQLVKRHITGTCSQDGDVYIRFPEGINPISSLKYREDIVGYWEVDFHDSVEIRFQRNTSPNVWTWGNYEKPGKGCLFNRRQIKEMGMIIK